jgi:hypothetical protein
MSRRPVAGALVILAIAAGAPSCAPSTTVHVKTEVTIVSGPDRRPLPTGSEQARAAASLAAIERTLGHPVSVEIDAAIAPASSEVLVRQAAASLEALASILDRDILADPLLGEFLKRKLVRIAARYRAAEREESTRFDTSTGSLVFEMREAGWVWISDGWSIDFALQDALSTDLAATFATRREEDIAPSDYPAYARYLIRGQGARGPGRLDADAARFLALLRLEARARSSPVHDTVEDYLARQARWFLQNAVQGAEFATVRRAYATWIRDRFFSTPVPVRRDLYRTLLWGAEARECLTDPCPRFPELDRTALLLSFLDRARNAVRDEQDADALCLRAETDGKLIDPHGCASVYGFLTANDARSDRLVEAMARLPRHDLLVAALAETNDMNVLVGALDRRGGPLLLEALRILANVDYYRFHDPGYVLRDQMGGLWTRHPEARPILLRLLVERYARDARDERFAALSADYGPFDAVLFAAFLDEGPRSVELAPVMWPALKGVATPFEIVAARLDGYIGARGLAAAKTVTGLLRRACEAKDLEGLRVLRVVLQKRVQAGDRDSLALALAARDCKTATTD